MFILTSSNDITSYTKRLGCQQDWVYFGKADRGIFECAVHMKTRSEFDVHVTVHRDKFLITKPTRCTNFSNLFLEWNSTCFGQFLCPSSGVFHCKYSNGICHTVLLTAGEQDQDVPSWSCSLAVRKPVWHIPLPCVQWKNPADGQRNCPKHVEIHSKNKFEKLVHLVGFIIRNPFRA